MIDGSRRIPLHIQRREYRARPEFQPIDRSPANARPELERLVIKMISRGVVGRRRLQLGCVHVDRLDPEFALNALRLTPPR